MKRPSLKNRLLTYLFENHPQEFRFSQLREDLGNPSKGVYVKALKELEADGLVDRTEISYKYVTYSLNLVNYKKMVAKNKKDTNSLYSQIEKVEGQFKVGVGK